MKFSRVYQSFYNQLLAILSIILGHNESKKCCVDSYGSRNFAHNEYKLTYVSLFLYLAKFLKLVAEVVSSHDCRFESRHFYFYFLFILPKIPKAERVQTTYFGLTIIFSILQIKNKNQPKPAKEL